jgi:hypothetical protein
MVGFLYASLPKHKKKPVAKKFEPNLHDFPGFFVRVCRARCEILRQILTFGESETSYLPV